jgi:hypothetical protein
MISGWILSLRSFCLSLLGSGTFNSLLQFSFLLDTLLSNTLLVLFYKLSYLEGYVTLFANSEFPLIYLEEPKHHSH